MRFSRHTLEFFLQVYTCCFEFFHLTPYADILGSFQDSIDDFRILKEQYRIGGNNEQSIRDRYRDNQYQGHHF